MAFDGFNIEKQSVTQSLPGQFSVNWDLILLDGVSELSRKTFSQDYKTGDPVSRVVIGFRKETRLHLH